MDASGISIINFKFNGKIVEDFDNKIERAMSSIAIEGVGFDSAHGIKYNTQYLTNNWRDNPDGEGYLQGRLAKGSIRKGLMVSGQKSMRSMTNTEMSPQKEVQMDPSQLQDQSPQQEA